MKFVLVTLKVRLRRIEGTLRWKKRNSVGSRGRGDVEGSVERARRGE